MKDYIKKYALEYNIERNKPTNKPDTIVFDPIHKGEYVTFRVTDKEDVPDISMSLLRANKYDSFDEMFESTRVKPVNHK